MTRPLIALAMGDPAGISPELTARLVADPEIRNRVRLLVIGDRRVLAMGASDAGVNADLPGLKPADYADPANYQQLTDHSLLDLGHLDPAQIQRATVSLAGGRFALTNFLTALQTAAASGADAVCFTPFNKQAMRLARPGYDDEIGVITEALQAETDGREFNILDSLWNARVTSHIALKDVAGALNSARICEAAVLADRCMREAGFDAPRIAIAALNPHAGDGGAFGREEIDLIQPAIEQMQAQGISAVGPVPADTVFVRARKGEFDAVLTMFHDQGQIAMKLLGFERGVTFLGGYRVPILTPAHGTAYDIAGKGIADAKASRNAILLAAEMAHHRQATAVSSTP
ncbi:MAG: 4-hydroxythreonine-4-phosphate dehydrogenase PdxA [Burkholderiaceae bacterium]